MIALSVLQSILLAGSLLSDLRSDPIAARDAARIAAEAAYAQLAGRPRPAPVTGSPALRRPGGAFVTAVRGGKVRGCWGSIAASTPDLAHEIAGAAAKAMHADYRHRPVNPHEWGSLELVVAVVGPLRRVDRRELLDPMHEGLFITNGSRGGVLLPGEARSARYQRAEVLRKAGLRATDPASSFRFETWTTTIKTSQVVGGKRYQVAAGGTPALPGGPKGASLEASHSKRPYSQATPSTTAGPKTGAWERRRLAGPTKPNQMHIGSIQP